MDLITKIRAEASKKHKTIVLPESHDIRTLKAAEFLTQNKICSVVLIGSEHTILSEAKSNQINLSGVSIVDPHSSIKYSGYVETFFEKRKSKGVTEQQAQKIMLNELYFAASMVSHGDADGCVAGAVNTTGDVLKSAFQVIGMRKGSSVVSSIFLMTLNNGRTFTYGDCAVVPYPDADQLASIATDSAITHRQLTGEEPKVAMLSFSTKGSATHTQVDLVKNAMDIATRKHPELQIDGEMQFDAAFVPEIGSRKAPESTVAGMANVFVFPNLDAGNIAYKITERLAGATATGPIIQGLNFPMNDLSRGCSWEDIVNTVSVTCLQSQS
jgi:phosphate acetyltransferase